MMRLIVIGDNVRLIRCVDVESAEIPNWWLALSNLQMSLWG
jgi:hypothetical protein